MLKIEQYFGKKTPFQVDRLKSSGDPQERAHGSRK